MSYGKRPGAWPPAPASRMGEARFWLALWRYRLRSPLAWLPPCKQPLFLPILGKSNLLLLAELATASWPQPLPHGLLVWSNGLAAWP
jgi:hypothetical protein